MSTGISFTTATLAAAQDACTVQADGYDAVTFQIGAGLTGTVTLEISVDGVTFSAIQGYGNVAGFASSGAITNPAAQVVVIPIASGVKTVRLRCSAFTSGSTVVIGAAEATGAPGLQLSSIVNQPNVALNSVAASAGQTSTFTVYRYKSTASDNLVAVKAAAGNVHHIVASNANAAIRYLKLYNKATAPVLASDTPVATIVIPASGTVVVPYDLIRFSFSLGIGHAIVTAAADATSGNTGADEVFLTMLYA